MKIISLFLFVSLYSLKASKKHHKILKNDTTVKTERKLSLGGMADSVLGLDDEIDRYEHQASITGLKDTLNTNEHFHQINSFKENLASLTDSVQTMYEAASTKIDQIQQLTRRQIAQNLKRKHSKKLM